MLLSGIRDDICGSQNGTTLTPSGGLPKLYRFARDLGFEKHRRMRFLVIALMGWIGASSVGNAQDWPAAEEYLNLPEDCWTISDSDRCEAVKAQWAEVYNKAISGDAIAQFEMAFCLSNGCELVYFGYLKQDPVLGCAWQIAMASKQGLEARGATVQAYCSEPFANSAGLILAHEQAKEITGLLDR